METKDFNFVDYYENVLNEKQQKYFKALIIMRLNIKPATFSTWLYRNDCPSSRQVHIQDMIERNENLPNYK